MCTLAVSSAVTRPFFEWFCGRNRCALIGPMAATTNAVCARVLPKSWRLRACLARCLTTASARQGSRGRIRRIAQTMSVRSGTRPIQSTARRSGTAQRNLMAIMHLGKSPAMRREQAEAAQ